MNRATCLGLCALASVILSYGTAFGQEPPPAVGAAVQPWTGPITPVLQQAAADYSVPYELLVVLGKVGSAFENRGDAPTVEGGYGVMALRDNPWGGDSLALASKLTGADMAQLKTD